MKYLILFLLLLPLSLFGQVESQFNGTLNIFSGYRIGSTNTFTISGIFSSTTSQYTSSQVDTGDVIQVLSGSQFYWFHVYSIASSSGGVITCNVRDSTSTRTVAPSGIVNLFRPTPNLRLPLQADGISNAAKSSVFNTLALRVDEIQTSVANSTNCEQTLTKNNHGFRKWTPIYWTGSTYVRPPYDSLVPDYIVVDSLTANTFKVANCGTYTTSLTNGLYWFTSASPGYSLTADTTKVPLFQVLNGKLLLQPIVGFNLMSGGGAGDVTRDELADSTAAIRADFPSGSGITALTGDVTASGTGSVAATIAPGAVGSDELASTAVMAGSYTNADITVDADGRITAAANGSNSSAIYESKIPETRQFQHSEDTTYFVPKATALETNPITSIDFSLFDWTAQSAPNVSSPIANNRNLTRPFSSQNLVSSSGSHSKWQIGEQGYSSAVRVNIPANNSGLGTYFNWSFLPAGTYTYRFRAKSLNNTPSIKVGIFGSETTITPTSSWATYTLTLTFASSGAAMSMTLCKPSNSSQDSISILFDEMQLQKTGEALDAYDHGAGNFYAGVINATSNTFWRKPYISSPIGSANLSTLGLSSGKDLTAIILFRPRITLASTGTFPLVEQAGDYNSSLFVFGNNIGGTLYNRLHYNTITTNAHIKQDYWNVATVRRNADTVSLSLNGVVVGSGIKTGTHAFSELRFGYVNNNVIGANNVGDIMLCNYYNKTITDDELYKLHSSYANRLQLSQAGVVDTSKAFFFEGDSNTQGDYASSWAGLFCIQNMPYSYYTNLASSGTGFAGLKSDIPQVISSAKHGALFGKKVVYAFMTGTNDTKLASDPVGYYADIVEAIRPLRAAGAYVVALPTLPKNPALYSGFNASRAIYVDLMKAGEGIDFDAVVDLTANSNLETWNMTYYYDDVHITALGKQLIADLFKAKMNTFLRSIK